MHVPTTTTRRKDRQPDVMEGDLGAWFDIPNSPITKRDCMVSSGELIEQGNK
jgi:hypothetical protein